MCGFKARNEKIVPFSPFTFWECGRSPSQLPAPGLSGLIIRNCAFKRAFSHSHQLFEGLKAYNGEDKRLRLFRPMLNMKRMSKSAKRACLPVRQRCWGGEGILKKWPPFLLLPPPLSLRLSTSPSCWSASGDWWRSSRTGLFCQNHHRTSTSDQHLLALR